MLIAPPPPVPRKVKMRSGELSRDEVTRVVDAGLGRFLQRVELDAILQGGRFAGFRILSLSPAAFWSGVDLQPGDVVTRVNGMSIERPPEAYRAFSSLKTADQLVVSYYRGGQPRELVFTIKEAPPDSAPDALPAPTASTSANDGS
jgi:S1-C subfamily serine protease